MDNLFITIAVAAMYALMLLASNRAQVSPTQKPTTTISTSASDTLVKPLPVFMLPDSAVAPDSTTTDTIK